MVRRLVEEQEVRAAHERLREVEPHPQAARKLRDRFVLARDRHAEPGEQRRRARARRITADLLEAMMKRGECCTLLGIRGRGPFRRLEGTLDVTEFAIAIEHELERGRRNRGRLLCHVGNRPGGGQLDVARIGVEFAAQEREQARLAATVRPDEPRLVPCVHREIGAFEQAHCAAGEREIRDADQGPLQDVKRREQVARAAALRERVVVVDDQRRVVREAPLLVDRGGVRSRGDPRRRDLVVDPPSDVLRPGLAPVRPPRVLVGPGIDAPKHVDETELVEYAREPIALFAAGSPSASGCCASS